MTFRRTIIVSIVIMVLAAMAMWPEPKTVSTTKPQNVEMPPVPLLKVSTAAHTTSQNSSFLRNTDGTFSTNHLKVARDPNSRWTNPAKPVDVIFPKQFSEPVAIKSGGAIAQCVAVNANPDSRPELIDNETLIYRDAFPGCDVKYKSTTYKTEEFILVKDSTALDAYGKISWSWDIQTEYDGKQLTPRLTPMHTIELADEQGVPRLRIDAPFGKDGNGSAILAEKHLKFSVVGSRLSLELDATNYQMPLEIDPSWSSTGTMSAGREGAQSVILNDGRVLIAGGANGTSNFSVTGSSEIYSPITETWSATGSLLVARFQHTLTLLQNGKVLVAGGEIQQGPSVSISECEIYDPATGLWTTTGSMNSIRSDHRAVLLANGNVIAIAGYNLSHLQSCELYNPSNGQWTPTGGIARTRPGFGVSRISNGKVVLAGGNAGLVPIEIYDPSGGTWSDGIQDSVNGRIGVSTITLDDDSIAVIGGIFGANFSSCPIATINSTQSGITDGPVLNPKSSAPLLVKIMPRKVLAISQDIAAPIPVVFDATSNTTKALPTMSIGRNGSTAQKISNSKILVACGVSSGNTYPTECEILDLRARALPKSVQCLSGGVVQFLLESDSIGENVVYQNVQGPLNGTITINGNNALYVPNPSFSGSDIVVISVNDSFGAGASAPITISVTPSPPLIDSITANPNPAPIGTPVTFTAAATDTQDISFSWDFGDGTTATGASVNHAFNAQGDYTITLTVTDAALSQTTQSISLHVGNSPKARFTTGDVVGFAGVPLIFDAVLSTDPENAIANYSWNFGDGTPNGGGQLLSKVYTEEGTYLVTLIITDAEGLQASTQRLIEVLSADQVGLFNAFVEFTTRFDRSKDAKDSITLKARLNVGDSQIGNGSAVALEIAGQRFATTLDRKFRASVKVAPKQTWKVKFGTRKQSAGQVDVQVTIKNADLGLGFNQLGAVAGGDDSASISVPVRLEVGEYSFEIPCDTEFDFNRAGTKAKGEGASE